MDGPAWMQHRHIVRVRQRSSAVDLALDVFAGYREHRSSRMAAALTYYGFLSLFPLLLVFTTVLGFVLEDNKSLQEKIVDTVIAKIPLIGDQIVQDPTSLQGNVWALVIGLLLALWAGLKAFVGLFGAFDDIAGTSLNHRSNPATVRARALLTIFVVGLSQIATAIISTLIGVAGFPRIGQIALFLSSAFISACVLAAVMRWLRTNHPSWRAVMPGALLGGVGFALLQLLGTTLVGRAIGNAGAIYGTFASVIGIMAYMNFHAYITLISAELNEVLVERSARDSDSHTGEVA